jgi:Tfp pilus assembly protein PilX
MNLRLKGHRGSLMLLALMFMTVMAVLASVFLYTVSVTNRLAGSQGSSLRAFYMAEAGVNKAIWYLRSDGAWWTTPYPAAAGSGANDPKNEPLGDGSYTMWVEHLGGGSVAITSSGAYRGSTRKVRVVVTPQCL